MKVYIVVEYEYGETNIIAAFSSKEKALKYIDEFEYSLEEVELDPEPIIPEGAFKKYRFYLNKDGSISDVIIKLSDDNINCYFSLLSGNRLLCEVVSLTKSRAIEIANVKRLEMIASGEWK